jgi:hypothetical protein
MYRVRGKELLGGTIYSESDLFKVLRDAQALYETEEVQVALRRIGKGVCPKSFPITKQSHYFLELFRLTHGGEYGLELMRLPLSGGVLDQPAIFYQASDIIRNVKSRFIKAKLDKPSERQDNLQGSDRPTGYIGR